MAHKKDFAEGATLKQKKAFAPFLSEDEELVLAVSYGKNYLRHKFAFYMMIPGGLFWILGLALAYFSQFNLGYGLLLGYACSMVLALIKSYWLYLGKTYILTTRRVIVKDGFFAVKLTSALYDKITHIEVAQTFFDRFVMHHGTLIINTAGASKDEITIDNVDAPIEFKNLLERLINRERVQMGRSTGPVVTMEGELV